MQVWEYTRGYSKGRYAFKGSEVCHREAFRSLCLGVIAGSKGFRLILNFLLRVTPALPNRSNDGEEGRRSCPFLDFLNLCEVSYPSPNLSVIGVTGDHSRG